jgi:hypothetical protein
MRSLPEKTMEHWTGLYLSSRFARAEQWWPTQGEDVRWTLQSTLTSPGKLIMLEVKVPEVTEGGRHTLRISTSQLHRYLRLRLPMFYVLPIPQWSGPLRPGASVPGSAAGWWRRRSDPDWFGRWTYVLPAADVASRLRRKNAAANPVFYTIPAKSIGPSSVPHVLRGAFAWPDFWSEIQTCGPPGATRWRITEEQHGFTVTDMATGELVEFAALLDQQQDNWLIRGEDHAVVFRVDEADLLVNS